MSAEWECAGIGVLLDCDSPSQAFAALEGRLGKIPAADQAPLRRQIIEALETAFKCGKSLTREWLRAILAASPNYLRASDETRPLPSTPSNLERLCALLVGGLEVRPASERGQLVGSIVNDLGDVSLLCALFHSADGDWTADRAHGAEDSFFGACAEAVRNDLFDRVSHLAKSGALWAQAAPSSLLWFWFACGQEQEVYIFAKQSMREAGSLRRLLAMPIDRVHAGDGHHDVIAVRRWSKILDFNGLEKRAVELVLSGAAKADKDCARRFLDAYANGKSDLFK